VSTVDVRKAFEDAFSDQLKVHISALFVNLAKGQTIAQAEAEFRKDVEQMKQAYDSAEALLTEIFS